MNSFYSEQELKKIGFKSYGENVLISRKSSIYSPEKMDIGSNVRIDDFCVLSGEIKLHSYIHIAAYCALYGSKGIEIKSFSGLSPRCTIFSVIDNFNGDWLISPMSQRIHNKLISGKVTIEKYSQLGAEVLVLPNVTISQGCAIGSKSLLNKSTKPWGIYYGQPALRKKDRNKGLLKFADNYNL